MSKNKKGKNMSAQVAATTQTTTAPKLPVPSANVHEIPCRLIVADQKWNARTELTGIQRLAEAVKKEGQLQPVMVAPRKDGKYDLIFGFRRFAAISGPAKDGCLERDTIRAIVRDGTDTEVEKLYLNIAENEARDDLSTWDRAQRYLMLSEQGESNGAIAKRVAKTDSYVSNLVANAKELIPTIQKRWKMECGSEYGGTRICTMDWLNKTRKLNEQEQQAALDKEMGTVAKPAKSDKGGGSGRVAAPREAATELKNATVAGKRELGKAIEACEARIAATKSEEKRTLYKGVLMGLKFAAGLEVTITGVYTGQEADSDSDE